MRASFKFYKHEKNPNIPEQNKFTLTYSQAATAIIQADGKWDSTYIGERSIIHATTPNAIRIKELKISDLPAQLSGKNFNPAITRLYMLIEILSNKKSRVELLDLSNYLFDKMSMLTLARAINDCKTDQYSLRKIKFKAKQAWLEFLNFSTIEIEKCKEHCPLSKFSVN